MENLQQLLDNGFAELAEGFIAAMKKLPNAAEDEIQRAIGTLMLPEAIGKLPNMKEYLFLHFDRDLDELKRIKVHYIKLEMEEVASLFRGAIQTYEFYEKQDLEGMGVVKQAFLKSE